MSYLSALVDPIPAQGQDISKESHPFLWGQMAGAVPLNIGSGVLETAGYIGGGVTESIVGRNDYSDYMFDNFVKNPAEIATNYNAGIKTITGQLVGTGLPMLAEAYLTGPAGLALIESTRRGVEEVNKGTSLGKAQALTMISGVANYVGAKYAGAIVGKEAEGLTALGQKIGSGASINLGLGIAQRGAEQAVTGEDAGIMSPQNLALDTILGGFFGILGDNARLSKNLKEYLPIEMQDALFTLSKEETLRRNGSPNPYTAESLNLLNGQETKNTAYLYTGKALDLYEAAIGQKGIKSEVRDGAAEVKTLQADAKLTYAQQLFNQVNKINAENSWNLGLETLPTLSERVKNRLSNGEAKQLYGNIKNTAYDLSILINKRQELLNTKKIDGSLPQKSIKAIRELNTKIDSLQKITNELTSKYSAHEDAKLAHTINEHVKNLKVDTLNPPLPIELAKELYPAEYHADLEVRAKMGDIPREPLPTMSAKVESAEGSSSVFGEVDLNGSKVDLDNMYKELGENSKVTIVDGESLKEITLKEYMDNHLEEIKPDLSLIEKAKQGTACIIGALVGG